MRSEEIAATRRHQLAPDLELEPSQTPAKPGSSNLSNVSNECDDVIELEFAGARLRMRGSVDETALMTVLRALRRSA